MVYWTDVSYLNRGTDRQRDAYLALIELDLFSVLAEFDPILAGSYVLGIQTPASRLEIICHVDVLGHLDAIVQDAYGGYEDFSLVYTEKWGVLGIECIFTYGDFTIEVSGQPVPIDEQVAYQHMIAEARLLQLAGEEANETIRRMREEGIMTLPAFGAYFHLEGDPADALLELAKAPTEDLVTLVARSNWLHRAEPQLTA